jgi:hypothetical protein
MLHITGTTKTCMVFCVHILRNELNNYLSEKAYDKTVKRNRVNTSVLYTLVLKSYIYIYKFTTEDSKPKNF